MVVRQICLVGWVAVGLLVTGPAEAQRPAQGNAAPQQRPGQQPAANNRPAAQPTPGKAAPGKGAPAAGKGQGAPAQNKAQPKPDPIGSNTSSEPALAVYADAANFLNGGAHDLAIEQWQRFLKEYPQDPLAPKAMHYLGVSLMQREKPDYARAAEAFEKALTAKNFELREDALANRGWCLYTAGRSEQTPEPQRAGLLGKALQVYADLMREFPSSKHLPQAQFFSGEAAYAMGNREEAVKLYAALLKSAAADSNLRCDAMYAQGVAEEELGRRDAALDTYSKLLSACATSPLIAEVQLRRGELLMAANQIEPALAAYKEAVKANGDLSDYAQYRYASALLKLKRGDEAGKAFQELSAKFPKSRYAATAELAAAQSFYQAKKYDEAKPLFQRLVAGEDPAAAIEAAHWLAQMAINSNQAAEAVEIAQKTLQAKTAAAPYRDALQLDVADALALQNKIDEALAAYAQVHDKSTDAALVSRALYGAAFTALQAKQSQKAIELANVFIKKFPEDPLLPDAAYVAAEGLLQAGQPAASRKAYEQLLKGAADHPSRSLWTLRAVTAAYMDGKFEDAAKAAAAAVNTVQTPREKAEANFLLGASLLFADKAGDAVGPLEKAANATDPWPQVAEAWLLLGQAQLKANAKDKAKQAWESLIAKYPKHPMADQGRYRMGQMSADGGDYASAQKLYETVLESSKDSNLLPYALYGRGWCLLQTQKYEDALKPLDEVLTKYPEHAIAKDAKLARGICLRRLGKSAEATEDLQSYLKTQPKGNELGHALYELALMQLKNNQADKAIESFKRLIAEVPTYPAMDKVLYELAWALKDGGKEEESAQQFELLVSKFPQNNLVPEASYHVGQQRYLANKWDDAVKLFERAAGMSTDPELQEKARYKLGWSHFQAGRYQEAKQNFEQLVKAFPDRNLALDARMMIAECEFKQNRFDAALVAFKDARAAVEKEPKDKKIEPQEQQVRELVLLHGGQSAAQLEQWQEALQWYGTLRERYPSTRYLAQAFYETGFCYQNLNQPQEALKYYNQVASNYRTEIAARARFMMGEIYFGERDPAKAIPEFQRVMLGFGAEAAAPEVKNWQAKSALEAGRCAELLIQDTTGDKRQRSIEISRQFYQYLVDKHPQHELVGKARERLEVLAKLK